MLDICRAMYSGKSRAFGRGFTFAQLTLSFRQLLSGVASLHVYADQFENIDKIADVDPTRDRVV